MIEDSATYFARGCGRCARFDTADCSARLWARGLAALRDLCLSAGLTETVKWGHPCYSHADRNIAIIGAFRSDFRLSFFNAALLRDPEAVLERQGPNTRYPDAIRFTSDHGPTDRRAVILAYLAEAKAHAAAGTLPPRDQGTRALPEELTRALKADPELARAFQALTRGRQNSYAVNLASAKRPQTRVARIAKFRDRIIAGKGATER